MKVFLWIWQLLQNVIGIILIAVTKATVKGRVINGKVVDYYVARRFNHTWSGVSLGNYIVFAKDAWADEISVRHEHGHQIQSLYLGPLYLIIVGIPSFVRNIWDRLAHKSWTNRQRIDWYYGHFPENQADYYGGVRR